MAKNYYKENLVAKLGKFKVGDFISSYSCEKGNKYMPGVGEIIAIRKDLERPYICEFSGKLYWYKAEEIGRNLVHRTEHLHQIQKEENQKQQRNILSDKACEICVDSFVEQMRKKCNKRRKLGRKSLDV